MRIAVRLAALLLLGLAFAMCMADTQIRLTAFPNLGCVADGRSTVSIKAELRDQNGRAVPDGTRVEFNPDFGHFKDGLYTTTGGVTFGILIAPTTPCTATITVSAPQVGASPSTITYDFVKDRSELAAKRFIEIVSTSYLQYTPRDPENKNAEIPNMISAASPHSGVKLTYGRTTVTANEMQYDIDHFELRAKGGINLKMGAVTGKFDELYLKLDVASGVIGYGTATYTSKRAHWIVALGSGIAFADQAPDGKLVIPPDQTHYGVVQIFPLGVMPAMGLNPEGTMRFLSPGKPVSSISAKKAVIYPKRKIQFQGAVLRVAGQKILTMPLFEYNLVAGSPLITEQMLAVTNSQVQLNYPYFLTLKPGETSLFRFSTGDQYGRTDTTDSGAFLNYEIYWDRGDDEQGSFVYSGIGRSDWTIGLNQYMRLDDRTQATIQLFTPAGESFFGSASANHQFNGYGLSVDGNVSRTVAGLQYTTEDYSATFADDPIKLGKSPFSLYLELTTTTAYNQLIDESQSGSGARARVQSTPIALDKVTSLTTSFTTSYLTGENELDGPQFLGTASLSHRFTKAFNASLTYNFTRDGFNQYFTGEHDFALQTRYETSSTSFSVMANKSADINSESLFSDFGYKLSKLWRLNTSFTYDEFEGTSFIDYDYGFLYRMGWREIGLIWSDQTRRVGFQFLGSTTF